MVERAGESKARAAGRLPTAWVLIAALVTIAMAGAAIGCGDDDDGGPATQTTETTTAPEEGEGEAGAGEEGAAEGDDTGGIDIASGNPKAGEALFADNCAVCHGSQGSGGNTGPSLQEPELAQESSDVVEQIVEGGGGMPPFGEQLSDQEIADVAAFVVKDLARR